MKRVKKKKNGTANILAKSHPVVPCREFSRKKSLQAWLPEFVVPYKEDTKLKKTFSLSSLTLIPLKSKGDHERGRRDLKGVGERHKFSFALNFLDYRKNNIYLGLLINT